jgi:hypothetical protein
VQSAGMVELGRARLSEHDLRTIGGSRRGTMAIEQVAPTQKKLAGHSGAQIPYLWHRGAPIPCGADPNATAVKVSLAKREQAPCHMTATHMTGYSYELGANLTTSAPFRTDATR